MFRDAQVETRNSFSIFPWIAPSNLQILPVGRELLLNSSAKIILTKINHAVSGLITSFKIKLTMNVAGHSFHPFQAPGKFAPPSIFLRLALKCRLLGSFSLLSPKSYSSSIYLATGSPETRSISPIQK